MKKYSHAPEKWMLLTVTGTGNVNESLHSSEYSCRQAECLARYGMDLEELERVEALPCHNSFSQVYSPNAGEWCDIVGPNMIIRNKHDVKTTKCFAVT